MQRITALLPWIVTVLREIVKPLVGSMMMIDIVLLPQMQYPEVFVRLTVVRTIALVGTVAVQFVTQAIVQPVHP